MIKFVILLLFFTSCRTLGGFESEIPDKNAKESQKNLFIEKNKITYIDPEMLTTANGNEYSSQKFLFDLRKISPDAYKLLLKYNKQTETIQAAGHASDFFSGVSTGTFSGKGRQAGDGAQIYNQYVNMETVKKRFNSDLKKYFKN